jgi:hypothetical protein
MQRANSKSLALGRSLRTLGMAVGIHDEASASASTNTPPPPPNTNYTALEQLQQVKDPLIQLVASRKDGQEESVQVRPPHAHLSHAATTQHIWEPQGPWLTTGLQRPQQERQGSRQACPLLQLLAMHPQGQGHQEIHHPQHG